MSYAEFIAGLIGPAFIAISASILLNRAAFKTMIAQIADNYAVIFLMGFLLFIAGLAIVRLHNTWDAGWQTLITLFGWLSMLGGLVRMMIPDQSATLAQRFSESDKAITATALMMLAFGAFLSAKGYALF